MMSKEKIAQLAQLITFGNALMKIRDAANNKEAVTLSPEENSALIFGIRALQNKSK
jgi:hypothetical protein